MDRCLLLYSLSQYMSTVLLSGKLLEELVANEAVIDAAIRAAKQGEQVLRAHLEELMGSNAQPHGQE
mgnify:CR=1 FL=1